MYRAFVPERFPWRGLHKDFKCAELIQRLLGVVVGLGKPTDAWIN